MAKKKKKSSNPAPRLFLALLILTAIGYYLYSHPDLFNNPRIKTLTGSVKGATSSIDTDKLKTKLVDPPEILSATENIAIDTGLIKEDETLTDLATSVTEKVKDLPKDQAKQIVRNTCQQIIDQIDSSY